MAFRDIRQKVLSGQIQLKKEAVWVPQWEEWVMVQELNGKERAAVIEGNTNKKTGQINITSFYPHLAIASVRYPAVDCEPLELEDTTDDENGEPITKLVPHPHLEEYPSLEYRKDNPQAGMLIFRRADEPNKPDLACRDTLNETSGAALEVIGQVAARLSGLLPTDLLEKKGR